MIFPRGYQVPQRLVLASGSSARRSLLRCADVHFDTLPVDVDEDRIRTALEKNGSDPDEVAMELAKRKAFAAAEIDPGAIVLGCDQVLEFEGKVLAKPKDRLDARRQVGFLNGRKHRLYSAVAICEAGQSVWQFTGKAELQMRRSSSEFLDAYIVRNWPGISDTVGCYKIEEEGIRLFCRIDGDHFTIVGLPLLEVMTYLVDRGLISG